MYQASGHHTWSWLNWFLDVMALPVLNLLALGLGDILRVLPGNLWYSITGSSRHCSTGLYSHTAQPRSRISLCVSSEAPSDKMITLNCLKWKSDTWCCKSYHVPKSCLRSMLRFTDEKGDGFSLLAICSLSLIWCFLYSCKYRIDIHWSMFLITNTVTYLSESRSLDLVVQLPQHRVPRQRLDVDILRQKPSWQVDIISAIQNWESILITKSSLFVVYQVKGLVIVNSALYLV